MKLTAFYLATLILAGLMILGILQMGSSLEMAGAASVEARRGGDVFQQFIAKLDTPLSHLFVQLLVIIAAARLAGMIFSRFGLPTVVGEMTAGILLGPSLFGWLAPDAFAFVFPPDSLGALRLLSQIGICLFMFVVGMELNVSHLRNRAKAVVAVSHSSIVVPFLMGVTLAWFLFQDYAGPKASFAGFALFMGIAMSITAFPVLARILQERGMTQTPLGSMVIACAAVDDVTAWTIMAFVIAVAGASGFGGAMMTMAFAALFVVFMLMVVRPLLPKLIGQEGLNRPKPADTTLAIIVCVIVGGALCTEIIGIHALFGAFLAGAIMPNMAGFREKVSARVEKFSTVLLLPLFFAFTGLRTRIDLIDDLNSWLLCGLVVLVATAGKLGASAVAARMAGLDTRQSLQVGALMNTRGLMELIALNIGYDMGILSPGIFTILVIMALVTTVMTGPLLTLFSRREDAGRSTGAGPETGIETGTEARAGA